ncbi:hypothetical protein TcWFU_002955 [Taenia crassiceps]|uniref:Uncharacterized protein n=1 Tax=Taenia crassiceps TaxID=6207 RepID=A0ABR4PZ95_9CEST
MPRSCSSAQRRHIRVHSQPCFHNDLDEHHVKSTGSRTKQAILPPYCIQHPVVVTQSPTQTGDQAGLRTPTPKSLLICALIPLPFQCFMSGLLSSTAAFSTSPLRSSPTAPLSAFLHTEAHPALAAQTPPLTLHSFVWLCLRKLD